MDEFDEKFVELRDDEEDMDDDNDGIDDDNDRCPGTKVGDRVDEEGCSAAQIIEEASEDEGLPGPGIFVATITILAVASIRRRL